MRERQWSDFKADYKSLLDFVDVFYSAILSVGLVLLGLLFDHHFDQGGFDWAAFILLTFSVMYLVGDYVDSRLFTAQYPYLGLARFFIDLIIGFIFFSSLVTGYHASPYFLVTMAAAFMVGGLWCICLQAGTGDLSPLRFPFAVTLGHITAAGIFFGLWVHHHSQQKLAVRDALEAVKVYGVWATVYVCAEITLNIPSKEADLLPNFPIGRVARNVKFIRAARNRLVDRSILLIGALFLKANTIWCKWMERWKDFLAKRHETNRKPGSTGDDTDQADKND